MIPPRFGDVGKAASDCLAKDFDVGRLTVAVEALSQSNVWAEQEITSKGVVDHRSNVASGDLQLTFRLPSLGTTLATQWRTANVVAANVKIDDAVAKNLSLEFDGKFMHTSLRTVPHGHALNSPPQHFVLGCEGTYHVERAKVEAGSLLAGYSGHDLTAVARIDMEGRVRCLVHHCISSHLELAADIGFTQKGTASTFQVVGLHRSEDTTTKVKVDQNGSVSLAHTRPLKAGLTLTLSALLEGSNLSTDVTHMGLALNIDVL